MKRLPSNLPPRAAPVPGEEGAHDPAADVALLEASRDVLARARAALADAIARVHRDASRAIDALDAHLAEPRADDETTRLVDDETTRRVDELRAAVRAAAAHAAPAIAELDRAIDEQARRIAAERAAPIAPLAEVEKRAFLRALERCGQSVPRAAEALGVSKVTFYAKLRAWGLHPKDRFDEESPTSARRQRAADPFDPPTQTHGARPPSSPKSSVQDADERDEGGGGGEGGNGGEDEERSPEHADDER